MGPLGRTKDFLGKTHSKGTESQADKMSCQKYIASGVAESLISLRFDPKPVLNGLKSTLKRGGHKV